MADNALRNDPVKVEDIVGVRSRISWGAVLSGSVIALATYLVLTLFFAAIGLSLTEAGVRGKTIGGAALFAGIATVILALFFGGWVTAQLTAGETEREAVLYGILTWAAVTGMSICLVGMGVRAGYFAVMGGTLVAQNTEAVQQRSWEDMARQAGVSQQRIDDAKASMDPKRAQEIANDPEAQERARQAAIATAWAALVGMMLSMAASIAGSMVGRGPAFRLFPVAASGQRSPLLVP